MSINTNIQKTYSGKKVLITGGLGFIGSTLALRLKEIGADVTLVDACVPDTGANEFNLNPHQGAFKVIKGDLAQIQHYEEELRSASFIFNLAGLLSHTDSMKNPLQDLHSNCTAHVHLLEFLKTNALLKTKILYAGTRGQYGTPQKNPVGEDHPQNAQDVNGINKTAGEAYHLLYSKKYGIHATSLRLSNTFGPRHQMRHPRQGVLNWFVRRVIDQEPVLIFGDGQQVRDLHYVDDVIEAMLLALASDRTSGKAYNLGGTPMSLKQVAEMLRSLEPAVKIEYKDFPSDFKSVEIGDYIADWSRIQRDLGWSSKVKPEQGFAATLAYYRQNRKHYW